MKSCAVSLRPAQGIDHPFVPRLHLLSSHHEALCHLTSSQEEG